MESIRHEFQDGICITCCGFPVAPSSSPLIEVTHKSIRIKLLKNCYNGAVVRQIEPEPMRDHLHVRLPVDTIVETLEEFHQTEPSGVHCYYFRYQGKIYSQRAEYIKII